MSCASSFALLIGVVGAGCKLAAAGCEARRAGMRVGRVAHVLVI